MAMTFTLVSRLRELLADIVRERSERRRQEEAEKERQLIEVRPLSLLLSVYGLSQHNQAEEARTRGTPVTVEAFLAWKVKFMKETTEKRAREDEEKTKTMTPKEREEYKRLATRPSGTMNAQSVPSLYQLFKF